MKELTKKQKKYYNEIYKDGYYKGLIVTSSLQTIILILYLIFSMLTIFKIGILIFIIAILNTSYFLVWYLNKRGLDNLSWNDLKYKK